MKTDTLQKFIQLKTEGEKELYYWEVDGVDLLFRPLSFAEFQIVMEMERQVDPLSVNDYILRVCTLECELGLPYWLKNSLAIRVDQVAQFILDISAFGKPEKFLEMVNEGRGLANTVNALLQKHICAAFPAYTPTQVEAMTLREQSYLLALAEDLLGQVIPFEEMFNPKKDRRRQMPSHIPMPPVPEGMETTEMPDIADHLTAGTADMPDWDKINSGTREVY